MSCSTALVLASTVPWESATSLGTSTDVRGDEVAEPLAVILVANSVRRKPSPAIFKSAKVEAESYHLAKRLIRF